MATLLRFHRLDGLIRQRSARFLGACRTGLSDFPNDVCTCSFHDLLHCSRRFQADAVARNQGYSMLCHCHSFCPAPQRIRVERNRLHRNAAQPEVPSLLSLNVVNDGLRLALQGTPAIMRIKRHTFNKRFLNVLRKLASGELRNSVQHVVELDITVIALDGFIDKRPDVLAALFGSGTICAEEAHSSQANEPILLIEQRILGTGKRLVSAARFHRNERGERIQAFPASLSLGTIQGIDQIGRIGNEQLGLTFADKRQRSRGILPIADAKSRLIARPIA